MKDKLATVILLAQKRLWRIENEEALSYSILKSWRLRAVAWVFRIELKILKKLKTPR